MHEKEPTNTPAESMEESSTPDQVDHSRIDEPAASDPAPLRIDLEYTDRVNFAMQQNGVPLIEHITVLNESEIAAADLVISLALENGASERWTKRFEAIPAEEAIRIEPEASEFRLRAIELAQRTEAERTMIVATVESSLGGPVTRSFPIDLLAFDHWPGVEYYPELLAAFITPNHPNIADLLKATRASLGALSAHDAIDGYQSGSRQRAALIAEAGFNALAARGIGYIGVPASFEKQGQRVRLVDRVLRESFGNCLDLSLVLAGVWEQSGLHALVLFTQGHAMPAVWTHASHLPEPAIDEPARIRNLIELGEIVPVEATTLTRSGGTFAQAVEAAKKTLANPGATFCAVDIRCSRKRGVRPLPLRDDVEGTTLDLSAIEPTPAPVTAGTMLDRVVLAERLERDLPVTPHEPEESGDDRILRWQKRLLDLSLRNRLINFRETKTTIRLNVPDIARLEDLLAGESRLAINPRAEGDDLFLREQLEAKHLYTTESPKETADRLLNIYRTARLSIEETGANLLHIALGMLRWYESPTSEQPRLAPLILLPVRLYRHATGSGYRYEFGLTDEPLRPNVTLLEKLRTEFGIDTAGLEDLPEDEKGIDVPLVLHRFRQAIRDTSRWEVEETAHLGLFSFNKFLMWRDLREHLDQLRQNRLVRHLIDREHGVFDPEPLPLAHTLDDDVAPGELLCTRDADSTQLAAIRAASTRRTFVLEGPPGTGKSQTIANIIADSLGRGKRVLFVAEKMAALTVVAKRLQEDGLAPFCLELHSAKASKKDVLLQLQAALDATASSLPADWDGLCSELGITRDTLNTYVRELHEVRRSGESLYQVLGRLSRLGDGLRTEPNTQDIASTTAAQLGEWRAAITNLLDGSERIDPPHEHPLRGIGRSAWSFTLPSEMAQCVESAKQSIDAVESTAQSVLLEIGKAAGTFAGDARKFCRDGVRSLVELATLLPESPAPSVQLVEQKDAAEVAANLRELIELGKRRDRLRGELAARYRVEFLDLDHLVHLDAVNRAAARPAFLKPIFAFLARRPLRPYCTQSVPPLDELAVDLETAREVKRLSQQLAASTDAALHFGRRWNNGEADWAALERVLTWCERFRNLADVVRREKDGEALINSLIKIATAGVPSVSLAESARSFEVAWRVWTDAWARIDETLNTGGDDELDQTAKQPWIPMIVETLERWSAAHAQMNDWCVWRRSRDAAVALGLTDLVKRYETGALPRTEIRDAFERGYGERWFNTVANSVDAIRTFNASSHEKTIERFRLLDRTLIQNTRHAITSKLREGLPSNVSQQVSAQSELGILRRELEKKSRHLPTRRLIGALPNLLPRLKPCFLMSPLSVAQFLDAGLPPFDLVVFDEASQIPVWDSIGAIARGTEVIVVGDSKQLPPTTFFNTLDGEDESVDEAIAIEDMESILKECNASGIPALWLKWHYRSRHETLISFSNHHYYRNELHTFPSPVERSPELGVTFRYVEDGVYDRGGSRTNEVEAQQVVDELMRRLTDTDRPDSIGVVTFNQAQQSLIEDLLDSKRREVPAIERHFTSEAEEPVFVKNLENVQGDERDTIIFSVGYGPDTDGRFSMNFGPLNQDGGERRLNVAITRARKRLIVFSSLRSDQIDLKRTRALGVRHFKQFLDYADRGPRALAEAVTFDGAREIEAGFERTVRDQLVARGWEVDTQVGCAGYRIDLAVRDPKTPGRNLLGIECDGRSYHAAKTARDRDRLREAVLRNLGWTIERIWSTEWRINPERVISTIERRLEALNASDDDSQPAAPNVATESDEPESMPINNAPNTIEEGSSEQATPPPTFPSYHRATPPETNLASLDLFAPTAMKAGTRSIEEIVHAEGPIVEELVLRRMAEWFGISRITDRYRSRFDELLGFVLRSGSVIREGDALWSADRSPKSFTAYRTPSPDEADQRDLEHIPLIERVNAVVHVVHAQFGLPREELEREAARALGFNRLTARIRELISEAIDDAIQRGLVQSADDRVSVP